MVELLVVIAVISVLILLLLPAVNAAARGGANERLQEQQRQLAIAAHNYHSARGHLPAGWIAEPDEPDGEPGWGWGVQLLPFMEEEALHAEFDLRSSIDDPGQPAAAGNRRADVSCVLPIPHSGSSNSTKARGTTTTMRRRSRRRSR